MSAPTSSRPPSVATSAADRSGGGSAGPSSATAKIRVDADRRPHIIPARRVIDIERLRSEPLPPPPPPVTCVVCGAVVDRRTGADLTRISHRFGAAGWCSAHDTLALTAPQIAKICRDANGPETKASKSSHVCVPRSTSVASHRACVHCGCDTADASRPRSDGDDDDDVAIVFRRSGWVVRSWCGSDCFSALTPDAFASFSPYYRPTTTPPAAASVVAEGDRTASPTPSPSAVRLVVDREEKQTESLCSRGTLDRTISHETRYWVSAACRS